MLIAGHGTYYSCHIYALYCNLVQCELMPVIKWNSNSAFLHWFISHCCWMWRSKICIVTIWCRPIQQRGQFRHKNEKEFLQFVLYLCHLWCDYFWDHYSLGSGKCELGYRIWNCHGMHRSDFGRIYCGNTDIPTT
uniref:Uncharacterized protein n=1 Tax=Arundo donax TaxID=35708 RepID=A0A0A9G1X2_ARUDO